MPNISLDLHPGRGFLYEHWVCEYWDRLAKRWFIADAEIDEFERNYYEVNIDPLNVDRNQFLVAGKAWQMCRLGEADSNNFGINALQGLWFIQGALMRDLAALNKTELLCWDCWELADRRSDDASSVEELALLDCVAVLTQAVDRSFGKLRLLYEHDRRLRVPSTILSYCMTGTRLVSLPYM